MSGRKPTIINLVATSPEGEVSNFYTLTNAANELGFHRSTCKRVYDSRRDWIGDYKLEWLNVSDKLEKEDMEEITKEREKAKEKKDKEKKYRTMAEKVKKEKVERDERRDAKLKARGKLVVKEVKNKCTYCGRDLRKEDKMDYFALSQMDKKGKSVSNKIYKSLNEASKDTGISMGALKNARDKMNDFVIRREDKVPFQIYWANIHMDCFQAKKENEREAERQERLEEERKEKEMISKMTAEELKEYRKKEKEESIKREIESNKKFDRLFGPK